MLNRPKKTYNAHHTHPPFFPQIEFLTESLEIMSFLFQSSGVTSLFYGDVSKFFSWNIRIHWAAAATVRHASTTRKHKDDLLKMGVMYSSLTKRQQEPTPSSATNQLFKTNGRRDGCHIDVCMTQER
jgi:hypothetical protein